MSEPVVLKSATVTVEPHNSNVKVEFSSSSDKRKCRSYHKLSFKILHSKHRDRAYSFVDSLRALAIYGPKIGLPLVWQDAVMVAIDPFQPYAHLSMAYRKWCLRLARVLRACKAYTDLQRAAPLDFKPYCRHASAAIREEWRLALSQRHYRPPSMVELSGLRFALERMGYWEDPEHHSFRRALLTLCSLGQTRPLVRPAGLPKQTWGLVRQIDYALGPTGIQGLAAFVDRDVTVRAVVSRIQLERLS